MSHYESSVPKAISANPKYLKYRRRLLHPRKNTVTPGVQLFMRGSYAVMAVLGVYSVLWMDWGDGDHCFRPIRRYFEQKKQEFFSLSPDDQEELRQQATALHSQGKA
ncbi:uncharacterized protein BJ171DRAFT_515131 [Polychytrium aggregatum]|uniref:uncharacterized protein n=1 Tax=Polychytrium aggregatum TaxID=110093 RepID=UPI0022FDDF0B|nr:uncharacterized protein BJ171DRAFT_515131 [Polychytrium aggregatum]KAI9202180.1 hypothetical protein BJ171DRAFT_515131 [Polychytrium aggregatum]